MDLSVVIIAKNEGEYIGDCIRSIYSAIPQSLESELILVDNESIDGTSEIASQFGIKIVRSDSKSIGDLRNIGAKNSSGSIIAYIDGDCLAPNDWVKNSFKFLEKGYDAIGGRLDLPVTANWVEKAWVPSKPKDKGVFIGKELVGASLFCKRDCFTRINGFRSDLATGEDSDLSKRLKERGYLVGVSNECNVIHRGYPKTLQGVFDRQAWQVRGQINGFSFLRDFSILLSLGFAIFLFSSLIFAFINGSFSILLLIVALGIIMLFTVRRLWGSRLAFSPSVFLGSVLVSLAYCLGRFWGVCSFFWGKEINRTYK